MADNTIKIPGRLVNASVNGYVTGAKDIIDDVKGKNQQAINAETDDSLSNLNDDLFTESSVRAKGDVNLQSQIDEGIRVVEGALEFDTVPVQGSAKPVLSSGIYDTKITVLDAIASTRTQSNSSNSWPTATYSLTGLRLGNGISSPLGEISVPSSGTLDNYKLYIYSVEKGTVIHWTSGLTESASADSSYYNIGFLRSLPSTVNANNLDGIQTEFPEAYVARKQTVDNTLVYEDIDATVVAPFDGYLVKYYYSDSNRWSLNKASCQIYSPEVVRGSDEVPRDGSTNWVESGGVYNELLKDRIEGKTLHLTTSMNVNKLYRDSGKFVSTSNTYYIVNFIPCIKGELFRIIYQATENGATTEKKFGVVHTTAVPAANVSYTTIYSLTMADANEHSLDFSAPDDGYICITYQITNTNPENFSKVEIWKWYDEEVTNDYVYKGFISTSYSSSNKSKYLNANPESQTFGEITSLASTNANFGVSDLIDVEGLSYIRIYNVKTVSTSIYGNQAGSIFYDSENQPISAACYLQFAPNSNFNSTIIVKVPTNAKYLRISAAGLTTASYLTKQSSIEVWSNEKLNTKLVVDSKPKAESTNLVESGGVYNELSNQLTTLKAVIGAEELTTGDRAIAETNESFSPSDTTVYNVGDISNSSYYKVNYLLKQYSKGTIVHFDGIVNHTNALAFSYGFTSINPAEYAETNSNLVGLELQNVATSPLAFTHSVDMMLPFDGWIVYRYYNNSSWSTFKFTVYDASKIYNNLLADLEYKEINIASLPERNYSVKTDTLKYGTSSNYKHILVDLDGVKELKVVTQNNKSTRVAWFTSDTASSSGGTPPLLEQKIYVFTGTKTFAVPSGAVYAYIYKGSKNANTPKYVGVIKGTAGENASMKVSSLQQEVAVDKRKTEFAIRAANMQPRPFTIPSDADGWELPENVCMQNVLKKALQMVNIRWTPKHNYPIPPNSSAPNTARYISAGTEFQHGIPYSNNNSRFKRVGLEVSIHTFMTAINNPYSLCYTEKIDDADHCSAWGEEYWATNGTGYYGTVCCVFTSAVLGIKFNVGNNNHMRSARVIGLFTPICKHLDEKTINLLRIGDVADDETHSGLVFAIQRDANGNVIKIKWAEATGSSGGNVTGCQIRQMTASAFIEYINTHNKGNMALFRYTGLYNNVNYEPSPYVPLSDYGETAETVTYNNDICTFAGDKATFMKGNLVVLNYNLAENLAHTWTSIKVCKSAKKSYEVLTTEPSNWSTGWKNYYQIVNGSIKKLTSSSAPTFAANTYHKKLTQSVEVWPDDPNEAYTYISSSVDWPSANITTYTLEQAAQTLTDFYANDGDAITPSPYNEGIDETGHALVLGKDLAAGHYRARMTDGTNYSDYTYWEVLNDNIPLTFNNDGSVTVTGNSSGKIAYIMVGYMHATNENYMYHGFWHTNVCIPPTIFEEMDNAMTIFPKKFRQMYVKTNSASHIVVMVEGRYGIAGTMPISIAIPEDDGEEEDDETD